MSKEERIREWVSDRLEDGMEEERLRKALREAGHDPSIVDEVQDPFSGGGEEAEIGEEDDVEASGPPERPGGPGEERPDGPGPGFSGEEDGGGEQRPGTGFSGGEDRVEEESSGPRLSAEEDERTGEAEGGDVDVSGPEKQPAGMLDQLEMPSGKVLGAAVLLLAVVGVGAGLLLLQPSVPDFSGVTEIASGGQQGQDLSSVERNCDVGVRIESASASGGQTTAELRVFRGETKAYLRLLSGGETVDEKRFVISDTKTVTLDGTGEIAEFGPIGCDFQDRLRVR